jgi:hypothetical protein
MVALHVAWEHRAPLRACLIADSDHVVEMKTPFDHRRDRLRRVRPDVEVRLAHGFDYDRIEFSGLDPGALGVKAVARDLVEEGLRHLAAGAIMDANEEDVLFHRASLNAAC